MKTKPSPDVRGAGILGIGLALAAALPIRVASADPPAAAPGPPAARKELRIPRTTKPWKDAFCLVGDGKTLYSDFALIEDRAGRWHCIGTFGKGSDGAGNGYALSDGYSLFHAFGSSLDAPMTHLEKIPYRIASPQAFMWSPAAIWNADRTTAFLFYFHYLGSSEFKENCARLLTSGAPDLAAWNLPDGAGLAEKNMVFRERDDRDFCVFRDESLGKYLMYYSSAGAYPGMPGLNTIVRVRTSEDLLHWSEPVTVMGPPPGGYQCAESPFVLHRDGYYYLWVSGIDYSRVSLYISEDPFDFGDPSANRIEEQPGHAPEIVSFKGRDYMACSMVSTVPSASPAAHDLDGVLIQPLRWDEPDAGLERRVRRSLPRGSAAAPAAPGGFRYFVGIVGNPSVPDVSWSDDQLEQIKALGVNVVQLSIAWGNKPADEVLNLEDLDAGQRENFAFRIRQAKLHGLRTMAQFGIPRMIGDRPACIMSPEVQGGYRGLLTDFMRSFPEVEDILVYTFDQRAWLCSEFGPCPRCIGLPLDERLAGFLDLLNGTMQDCRPGSRLWWKPWELSKGQVVAILDKVKPAHLGLVLNPSTSNEVYPFNDRSFKSDLGVKRLVRMSFERGIPVLGEFDHTLYKPLYLMEDFFPRLIHEQMLGWKEMEGVVGVKEYYGFAPSTFSVNAAMLRAWMRSPQASLDTLLREIAAPYGPRSAPLLIRAWEFVAQSVEAFPWDTTYLIGQMGLDRGRDGSHGWEPASILNATWDTPIWKANRRANFMLTQDKKAHPWLFEDAGLRLEDCAALGFKAVAVYDQAIQEGESRADDIRTQRDVVWKTARSVRGKSLHLLETLAAQDARTVQPDEKQFGLVVRRLEALLRKDVENQGGAAGIAGKLAEFQRDPKAWLNAHLDPRLGEPAPKGYEAFSNATMEWSTWAPPRKDR